MSHSMLVYKNGIVHICSFVLFSYKYFKLAFAVAGGLRKMCTWYEVTHVNNIVKLGIYCPEIVVKMHLWDWIFLCRLSHFLSHFHVKWVCKCHKYSAFVVLQSKAFFGMTTHHASFIPLGTIFLYNGASTMDSN